MIKRYEFHSDRYGESEIREGANGAYVLYNDHAARIAELEAALKGILSYVEKYTRMANTEPWRLQRAQDALAKEIL